MRFSQRIGKRPIKTVLQVESIDDDLRNRLWNVILEVFFYKISDSPNGNDTVGVVTKVCKFIWKEFFNKAIDVIPSYQGGGVYAKGVIEYIRKWFYEAEWYEVYDLLEHLAMIDSSSFKIKFIEACNWALKKEVSGYRIVNDRIVQITSEEEVREIEEAVNISDKWESVNTYLRTSLDLLADRKSPEYRNSIKESISAVESFCKIITGNEKASLGEALTEIEKMHSLHSALKKSFSALYGYTSDAGGIRHALLEGSTTVGFEDAKFMLVSCSAFINYLKVKLNL